MVNFPKRAESVVAEIDDESRFVLQPLSDRQASAAFSSLVDHVDGLDEERAVPATIRQSGSNWYEIVRGEEVLDKKQGKQAAMDRAEEINEESGVDIAEVAVSEIEAVAPLMGLFDQNVRSAEGVEVGGEPFDPDSERHLASIPMGVKARAINELLNERFMDAETGKD